MGRWVWVKGSASTLGSTNSKLIWSAWLTWHTVPYIWPKLSKRREKSLENALCIKTEHTALLCIDCIAQIVCNNQTEIVRIRGKKIKLLLFLWEGAILLLFFSSMPKTSITMQRGDNNFIHELVHGHKWIMKFLKCPLKCKTVVFGILCWYVQTRS